MSKLHFFILTFLITSLTLPFVGDSEDRPAVEKTAPPKEDEVANPNQKWQLFKHEGRDDVTVKNISEFYHFKGRRDLKNSVVLSVRKNILLAIAKNKAEIHVNKILFHLAVPTVTINDKLLDLLKSGTQATPVSFY